MYFLDNVNYCMGLGDVITIIYNVVNLIKWAVPILLIIFGTLDLAKAVIAGKEDEMKKAQSTLIKRAIYAVAVFLVVTLVVFIMGLIPVNDNTGDTSTWKDCWQKQG